MMTSFWPGEFLQVGTYIQVGPLEEREPQQETRSACLFQSSEHQIERGQASRATLTPVCHHTNGDDE
jgi:hypothetical protein